MKSVNLFPRVTEEGFANSGLSAVINDRNTQLRIAGKTAYDDDTYRAEWYIKAEDDKTYCVEIPVEIEYDSDNDQSILTYHKGNYNVSEVSNFDWGEN